MLVTPSIPLEGDDQGSVRTNAVGRRFAVLRPASDDALVTPSIPLEGDDQGSVRTNAAGWRFAVLRPASEDAW